MNATSLSTRKSNASFRFSLWATIAYLKKIQNESYKALRFVDLPIDLGQVIAIVNICLKQQSITKKITSFYTVRCYHTPMFIG
jgi:hypothetical protein